MTSTVSAVRGLALQCGAMSMRNCIRAMDVFGAAVERANGLPLAPAVKAIVTDPLGIGNTGFTLIDCYASK